MIMIIIMMIILIMHTMEYPIPLKGLFKFDVDNESLAQNDIV